MFLLQPFPDILIRNPCIYFHITGRVCIQSSFLKRISGRGVATYMCRVSKVLGTLLGVLLKLCKLCEISLLAYTDRETEAQRRKATGL